MDYVKRYVSIIHHDKNNKQKNKVVYELKKKLENYDYNYHKYMYLLWRSEIESYDKYLEKVNKYKIPIPKYIFKNDETCKYNVKIFLENMGEEKFSEMSDVDKDVFKTRKSQVIKEILDGKDTITSRNILLYDEMQDKMRYRIKLNSY